MFKEESMFKEGDLGDFIERYINDLIVVLFILFVVNVVIFGDYELFVVINDFWFDEIFYFEIFSDVNFSCDSIIGMLDNIVSLIEVFLWEGDELDDKEDLFLVLWDFGG